MPRFALLALALAGCSNSGLSYDNEDALGPIPDAPEVVPREDVSDPPYEPPASEVDDPSDEPPPEEPPEDPVDPPEEEDPIEDDPIEDDPVQDDPPEPAPACAPGLICVDSFPYVESNTTVGGPSQMDAYGCDWSIDESGPERIYQVELDEPGFLAITLWGMAPGVDVDVHLLGALDAGSCIDRGHWDAASLLQPGTYFVVADSWNGNGSAGDYSIRFQHNTYDMFAGDGLRPHVMEDALTIFDSAWHWGETSRLLYTVSDYTLPSSEERLWTFDLATGDLLFNAHVTHGSGGQDPSDPSMVAQMSNISGSHMSSVGLMRTAETYMGSNGYSMRLDGLEAGFNDAVRPRAIVFHEATYATPAFVAQNGFLGRSWGCPAVDPLINADLIDTIKNGSLYLSYFDQSGWFSDSAYL